MAALITVNGVNVTEATIHLPRIGVWHADLNISRDDKETMTGQATIQFGSQQFIGIFAQVGLDIENRLRARIVGGNGALGTLLKPKGYNTVPIQIPLQDVVTDSQELGLSQESDSSILSSQLSAWSRMQETGGSVITALLDTLDRIASWRILSDGTIWVGYESWPVVTLPTAGLSGSEPEKGRIRIVTTDPVISPGDAFSFTPPGQPSQTQNVENVIHTIYPDLCETTIYYEIGDPNAF